MTILISGCVDFKHVNEYDPKNPQLKNAGVNAHFSITKYTISDEEYYLGDVNKNISITFINDGRGSTIGPLNCYLSTVDESVRFLAPFSGWDKLKLDNISPENIMNLNYNFYIPISRPYNITFELKIIDSYSNEFIDSLKVTIN